MQCVGKNICHNIIIFTTFLLRHYKSCFHGPENITPASRTKCILLILPLQIFHLAKWKHLLQNLIFNHIFILILRKGSIFFFQMLRPYCHLCSLEKKNVYFLCSHIVPLWQYVQCKAFGGDIWAQMLHLNQQMGMGPDSHSFSSHLAPQSTVPHKGCADMSDLNQEPSIKYKETETQRFSHWFPVSPHTWCGCTGIYTGIYYCVTTWLGELLHVCMCVSVCVCAKAHLFNGTHPLSTTDKRDHCPNPPQCSFMHGWN